MAWGRINRPSIGVYSRKFILSSNIKRWYLKDICVAGTDFVGTKSKQARNLSEVGCLHHLLFFKFYFIVNNFAFKSVVFFIFALYFFNYIAMTLSFCISLLRLPLR